MNYLREFSKEMEAADVIFDSIPLWIGFKGLELKHYKPTIIKMIVSKGCEVDEVTPKEIIPRSLVGIEENQD